MDNFVSAGIVNTRTTLIGCLMRLEPNKETKVTLWGGVVKCGYYYCHTFFFQMYLITVRTSSEVVSRKICDILSKQFSQKDVVSFHSIQEIVFIVVYINIVISCLYTVLCAE